MESIESHRESKESTTTQTSVEVKILGGVEFRPDKNGVYRNKQGHIMKGQNMAHLRKAKRAKADRIANATPTEIRDYIGKHMTEVVDVLIEAAVKERDVQAATILINKCVPSLKALELTGETQLPTLVINQHFTQAMKESGRVIDANHTASGPVISPISPVDKPVDDRGSREGGTPAFCDPVPSTRRHVDNFCENEEVNVVSSSVNDESADDSGDDVSPISPIDDTQPAVANNIGRLGITDEPEELPDSGNQEGFMEPEP